MAHERGIQKSLQERVSDYLHVSNAHQNAFTAAAAQVAEAHSLQYLLERAEADLRAAQARVDGLKREIAKQNE